MPITSNPRRAATARNPSLSAASPASFRARLSGLDNDDLAVRADRLIEVLSELRHSRLSARQRFDILRQCHVFAAELRINLARQLIGLSLPPPPEQLKLSRRCAHAYRLMADCFRGVAEQTGGLASAKRLATCCYRGLNCLADYIVIRCECYLKASNGVWLDVHRLHDLAAAEGVEQLVVDTRSGAGGSVDHAYKRMLLLGLSDPFQHPFRSLGRVYEKLDDWATLARLDAGSKPASRCVFVVDPRLDRPASPALSQTALRGEFNQTWFNTRELVTRLKHDYDSAIHRSANQFQRHDISESELDSVDFLRRMIVRWGIHPVRAGRRRKTGRDCQVVSGLQAVCTALNDFNRLATSDTVTGHGLRRMIHGHHRHDDSETVAAALIRTGWEVEDESDAGFKLVSRAATRCGFGVDDVVAIRTGDRRDWSVGIVHWAQTDEAGAVALGVRLLRQTPHPVVISRLHAQSGQTRDAALMLVDRADDRLRRSLLGPPSRYFPTGTYLVQLPERGREFVVEATNMILASRACAWFEVVKPQPDSAQRVLDLIEHQIEHQ